MANKIKNKYEAPKSTEFTPRDLIVDVKNGHLYYNGYMEKDWISAENWSGINNWMGSIEKQSQLIRAFLMKKYNCNIHSLNPFINLQLEDYLYEPF